MTTAGAGDIAFLDERTLIDHVTSRRWFGSKAREVSHANVLDTAVLHEGDPALVLAVVEIRFLPGTHELYQLLLGLRTGEWDGDVIARDDGRVVYDALADPELAQTLGELMRDDATIEAGEGSVELRSLDGELGAKLTSPRPAGVEQSNSSVIFGDALILKAYRRLEPGINPELELLRFLTQRGFPNIATLAGWYAYAGQPLGTTLGILQRFVSGATDGWTLALEEAASFLEHARRLGEVTGAMHTALVGEPGDPDFCAEETSAEALPLLTATVDEEIERAFLELPQDNEALTAITGRGEEVRDRLRLISHLGPVGRVIRHHGDYHLGQVLWDGADWVVLDFEGEPARTLPERRRKRSPLRDVAGMVRSFAYAASALEIERGKPAPDGWERRAREEFLRGYFDTVERSLVPPSDDARQKLLAVFELEKAVYELRYELNNRPDWVRIPVAGILRLLEDES